MKRIYIVVILIIVAGVLFFGFKNNKLEAPVVEDVKEFEGIVVDDDLKIPPRACTMDAKMCPDGSYVGRTGPNCEFEACPVVKKNEVKEFVVVGKNFSFAPEMITVKKGDRVKIIFKNSAGFHDFKIDEYGIVTQQTKSPTTEVLEFTADKAGSFEYYCSVGSHRAMGMKGTLKVSE